MNRTIEYKSVFAGVSLMLLGFAIMFSSNDASLNVIFITIGIFGGLLLTILGVMIASSALITGTGK